MRDKLLNGWRRVKESAMLYGVLGTGVRIGANVILLPIVLSKLSTAELRLWWVFLALGGVANLVNQSPRWLRNINRLHVPDSRSC